ncbi:MAG: hypothetical protein ACR2JH_07445 [Solirubrobacteraceae bacterium]
MAVSGELDLACAGEPEALDQPSRVDEIQRPVCHSKVIRKRNFTRITKITTLPRPGAATPAAFGALTSTTNEKSP